MKYLKILSSLLFIGLLSGCQTLESIYDDFSNIKAGNFTVAKAVDGESEALLQSPCPEVEIVGDLSSLSDFLNPRKPSKNSLISRVDLKSAESSCKLASKSAVVDLTLLFNGTLGPKGRMKNSDKPFFSYPFFIAVTSPGGKIMAKEIFAASITYNANENKHTYFENLRQIIPIKSTPLAKHYKVLVGFQVTPDQLAYNRANMVKVSK